MQFGGKGYDGGDFEQHVNNLRGTMFYVCQGSCLCGTVNNRGKVIYCYGDLVPRHGELFSESGTTNGRTTPRDLLAAQLGIWVFGLIALLIVLLLIRKSISSLREHIEKVTERLPWYHDDDDLLSNHSTATSPPLQHKDTTMESMVGDEVWSLSFPLLYLWPQQNLIFSYPFHYPLYKPEKFNLGKIIFSTFILSRRKVITKDMKTKIFSKRKLYIWSFLFYQKYLSLPHLLPDIASYNNNFYIC